MNFAFSLSYCALASAQLFFWYSFASSICDWMCDVNFAGAEVRLLITCWASAFATPVIIMNANDASVTNTNCFNLVIVVPFYLTFSIKFSVLPPRVSQKDSKAFSLFSFLTIC